MSTNQPVSKTVVFEDKRVQASDNVVAVVTFSAAKLVKSSNCYELLDGEGKTLVYIKWPDSLKPREI